MEDEQRKGWSIDELSVDCDRYLYWVDSDEANQTHRLTHRYGEEDQCHICDHKESIVEMRHHIKKEHRGETFYCGSCQAESKNAAKFEKHMMAHRITVELEGVFLCKYPNCTSAFHKGAKAFLEHGESHRDGPGGGKQGEFLTHNLSTYEELMSLHKYMDSSSDDSP